ncbi:hypothetical protein FKM82_030874 [Ascaphus truei]
MHQGRERQDAQNVGRHHAGAALLVDLVSLPPVSTTARASHRLGTVLYVANSASLSLCQLTFITVNGQALYGGVFYLFLYKGNKM